MSPATGPVVALVGTLDTKGDEYEYVRERLVEFGCATFVVDAGVLADPTVACDVTAETVAIAGGAALHRLREAGDRNAAVSAMAAGAARIVAERHAAARLDAVLVLGGSNGAAIMSAVAAALPIGVPKLLVSTVAAGDTRPYVGSVDLTLMYPVVDISGLNRISRRILANAAGACAGMARVRAPADGGAKVATVALSMFGVTTACGTAVRDGLSTHGIETITFHATGVGGRTMEALIGDGYFDAVADITTTELADDLAGGVCSAGPDRLTAAAAAGIPQVVSLGALDMVNFGPRDTVPARYQDRRLRQHNPDVTLMRTTSAECAELGSRLAHKLNRARGLVALHVPLRGVSQISAPGMPFHDPVADRALIDSLKAHLESRIAVREFDCNINDPEFAAAIVDTLAGWLRNRKGARR